MHPIFRTAIGTFLAIIAAVTVLMFASQISGRSAYTGEELRPDTPQSVDAPATSTQDATSQTECNDLGGTWDALAEECNSAGALP